MAQKPPWHMTPDEFGRAYPPLRTIGLANRPEWRFLPHLPARDTRVAAVQDAHRHFVTRALEEGCAVPDHVAALYRPPEPPTTPKVQAEPDFIRLVAERPNEASDEPLRKAQASTDLAEQAIGVISGTTRAIAALAEQVGEQRALSATVATGLVKALHQETERSHGMTELMRDCADDSAAAIERINTTLADIARQQAKMLAEARKPGPAKPKKWTFKITRDAHGNIEALDATPAG